MYLFFPKSVSFLSVNCSNKRSNLVNALRVYILPDSYTIECDASKLLPTLRHESTTKLHLHTMLLIAVSTTLKFQPLDTSTVFSDVLLEVPVMKEDSLIVNKFDGAE